MALGRRWLCSGWSSSGPGAHGVSPGRAPPAASGHPLWAGVLSAWPSPDPLLRMSSPTAGICTAAGKGLSRGLPHPGDRSPSRGGCSTDVTPICRRKAAWHQSLLAGGGHRHCRLLLPSHAAGVWGGCSGMIGTAWSGCYSSVPGLVLFFKTAPEELNVAR